jgi:probable HAF family extracellular repeat protein
MRTNLTHFVAATMRWKLCIFAAAIALLPAIGRSQEYTVTDLGDFGAGASAPVAVNNKGQVAGWSDAPNGFENEAITYPFLYSNGVMNRLTWNDQYMFGGPLGMNDDGTIVGEFASYNYPTSTFAFLWNGAEQTLTPPPTDSYASAINEDGIAIGIYGYVGDPSDINGWYLQGGVPIGVIFSGGDIIDIPTGPYAAVMPIGINNAEQIAALCFTAKGATPGCIVSGVQQQLLQTGHALKGDVQAYPAAINASGDTCGAIYTGSYMGPTATVATYWKGLVPTNLGNPPNSKNSQCYGMDDFGNGVGGATSKTEGPIGVHYDPVNGAQDLNTLIPKTFHKGHMFRITNAVSISDTGFIAAQCLYENGNNDACLLTPELTVVFVNSLEALAKSEPRCTSCEDELVAEAHTLPKSLAGLSGRQRERMISTMKLLGEQIEELEREGKIPDSKAMVLLHDAELVLAAVEPRG